MQKMMYVLAALCILATIKLTNACSEIVCGPIVTKCALIGLCLCDSPNIPQNVSATCKSKCYKCLNHLFDECCSCYGWCPLNKVPVKPIGMYKSSYVEDLSRPVPSLFETLTSEEDGTGPWESFTFPVGEPNYIANKRDMQDVENQIPSVNCRVAFMTECKPLSSCRSICQSMGASSMRWFHDSCCECIGENCINYGIKESKCKLCPVKEVGNDLNEPYDDYGEDEESLLYHIF